MTGSLTTHYIITSPGISPDSGSKMRVFPHLIVRHDIERAPVQGEGHVPQDGAALLHHSHCLVQYSSFQMTVHSDLQRHRQMGAQGDSEHLAAGHSEDIATVRLCSDLTLATFFSRFILLPTVRQQLMTWHHHKILENKMYLFNLMTTVFNFLQSLGVFLPPFTFLFIVK